MAKAVIARGRMQDPRHIELDEPVTDLDGEIEVVLRSARATHRAEPFETWRQAFDAWVEGHDRSLPIPTPESLRREAIYEERT